MFKKLLIVLIPFVVISCHSSIQDKLISHFQDIKAKDSCYVKISDFTTFDWDSLYVFVGYTSLDEVNMILGFEYPFFIEDTQRMIFIKSNKIVHHEDLTTDFEDPTPIYFALGANTDKYKLLTQDSDSFLIERLDFVGNIIYQVSPLQLNDSEVIDINKNKK